MLTVVGTRRSADKKKKDIMKGQQGKAGRALSNLEPNPFDLPPPPGQRKIDRFLSTPVTVTTSVRHNYQLKLKKKTVTTGKDSLDTNPFASPPPQGQTNIRKIIMALSGSTSTIKQSILSSICSALFFYFQLLQCWFVKTNDNKIEHSN